MIPRIHITSITRTTIDMRTEIELIANESLEKQKGLKIVI